MKGYVKNKEILNKDCYNCNHRRNLGLLWNYSLKEHKLKVSEQYNLFEFYIISKKHNPFTEEWIDTYNRNPIVENISLIEKQFNKLATKWKNETGIFSTTPQKVFNDSYLDIIGLGKDVIPFILKDMEHGSAHWHTALKALTKENPVPNEDLSKSKKVREAWLTWGKNNNLIF